MTAVKRLQEALDYAAVPLLLVGLILVWEIGVRVSGVPEFLLPSASDVGFAILDHQRSLLANAEVTLLETLAGFGLSIGIGVPLAVLIVASPLVERLLYPLLVASQAVPKVALAPLLLVSLGYGVAPKIVVALLIAFFPVVVNTVSGLSSVNRDTLKLMRSMGASRAQVFAKLRFPNAVPSMMAGFKVAIALAVVGAVVGEFVGSRDGLGYYMLSAAGNFDTPLVFACVAILTVLGVLLFYAVALLEKCLGRWNRLTNHEAAGAAGSFGM
jgi:NitT/TauT family transport system permease protein